MSYEHRDGQITAIYRPFAEEPDLVGARGSMSFVAPGRMTRRQFGLFRRDMEPHAGGPEAHFRMSRRRC